MALEKQIFYQRYMILGWKGERGALLREQGSLSTAYPPEEPKNPFPRVLRRTLGGSLVIIAVITAVITLLLGPDKSWIGAYGGILLALIFAYAVYSTEKDDLETWGHPKSRQKLFDEYKEKTLAHQSKTLTCANREALVAARREVLQEAIQAEKASLDANQKALEAHYGEMGLYPKYQHLMLVCSLCEYIQSGRCDKLEGPDGAYALLEKELYQKTIVAEPHELNWKGAQTRQFVAHATLKEIESMSIIRSAEIDRLVEERLER